MARPGGLSWVQEARSVCAADHIHVAGLQPEGGRWTSQTGFEDDYESSLEMRGGLTALREG